PYEVVKYSMDHALTKLVAMGETKNTSSTKLAAGSSTSSATVVTASSQWMQGAIPNSKLRPWLQDFNLGATYDAPMVRKQIQAVYDALANGSSTGHYDGWLLWNAGNNYTTGALQPK